MPKGVGYGKKQMGGGEHPVSKSGRKALAVRRRARGQARAAEVSKGRQGRLASRKAHSLARRKGGEKASRKYGAYRRA
jgi:hypothetical protein